MAEDPLMTPDEVAGILRVTVESVYNLAKSGELRGIKIMGRWRFEREALREYIAQAVPDDDEEYEDEEEHDDADEV